MFPNKKYKKSIPSTEIIKNINAKRAKSCVKVQDKDIDVYAWDGNNSNCLVRFSVMTQSKFKI